MAEEAMAEEVMAELMAELVEEELDTEEEDMEAVVIMGQVEEEVDMVITRFIMENTMTITQVMTLI
jgi:rubrerythrin